MKFPSINTLFEESKSIILRFPFELLCALIGSATWIKFAETDFHGDDFEEYTKILLPCLLGLVLYFSATLFSESRNLTKQKWWMYGVITLFLVLYYFSLGDKLTESDLIRFALLSLSFHLLVSFSPFIGKGNLNGFWQFNKTLFIRILTSILFSAALYLGLAGALAAIDALFNVDIPSKRYFQLWAFIAGVFNTMFFLGGIPKDIVGFEENDTYPKGLKIFTQYVLVPLVTIYLFILYAYEFKILLSWSLPKGWVSYLVIAYSVAGILSILLIYPIRNAEGNKWIQIFSRWFYLAIFPLVILMLFAIGIRVKEYGITENRYFILVLTLWLLFIAGYFIISKKQNIKVIPVSLFIISLLASWGPQSAFSVSRFSQISRFESLLIKNNMLYNGKIKKASGKIAFNDQKSMSTIVEYLYEKHGIKSLQPLFNENLDSLNTHKYDTPDTLMQIMGLKYLSKWASEVPDHGYLEIRSDKNNMLNVRNFEFVTSIEMYTQDEKMNMGNDYIDIKIESGRVIVNINSKESLFFNLNQIETKISSPLTNKYLLTVPPENLTLKDSTAHYYSELHLEMINLNFERKDKSTERIVSNFKGYLLIRSK